MYPSHPFPALLNPTGLHREPNLYKKDLIFIYEGKNKGYVLKKSFLKNENEFAGLSDFLKEHYYA